MHSILHLSSCIYVVLSSHKDASIHAVTQARTHSHSMRGNVVAQGHSNMRSIHQGLNGKAYGS